MTFDPLILFHGVTVEPVVATVVVVLIIAWVAAHS
jgi:hypothetical protein